MIPIREIDQLLTTSLLSYLHIPVVPYDSIDNFPEDRLITCNYSRPVGEASGRPVLTVENGEPTLNETVTLQATFLSYAVEGLQRIEQTLQVRDWFLTEGCTLLKEKLGVVVARIGMIENRDIQISSRWERRYGMDIELRVRHILSRPLEVVEDVQLRGVEPFGQ
ncbi:hypothetical protein DNH61_07750 [Paenibacillus sambharensis]|uniref:Phage neck terminator protein gp12-like domain-containing protein n=1 Tax=Paenibacillus sambharensis TaxID=1803190 RepID=A0A2W1LB03_9BACL|nr:hypothetical protein [Paenibacillus sambharensis]PZD96396.1 hypothetical protein DNH61_07750 [Paenibacillus sambharensis]